MRIIAGSAGGTPLKVPAEGSRPTSDRVREALFSILGERASGARRVLDLFAGSGALGLEALSRGAGHATFVEIQRKACEVIEANLLKARLKDRAKVVCADTFRFLARQEGGSPFDLVFADPPYCKRPEDRDFERDLFASEIWASLIAPGGMLVLESGRGGAKGVSPFWEERDRRSYGDTVLTFLAPSAA